MGELSGTWCFFPRFTNQCNYSDLTIKKHVFSGVKLAPCMEIRGGNGISQLFCGSITVGPPSRVLISPVAAIVDDSDYLSSCGFVNGWIIPFYSPNCLDDGSLTYLPSSWYIPHRGLHHAGFSIAELNWREIKGNKHQQNTGKLLQSRTWCLQCVFLNP
jgi:hypothetical protein